MPGSYDRVSDDEVAAGAFVLSTTGVKYRDNQDFFAGQIGSLSTAVLPNGSFEIASDEAQPNLPDNWELTRYPNGVFILDDTSVNHGSKSAKFTHPGGAGNGGGYLTSDLFAVNAGGTCDVGFIHWVSDKDIKVKAELLFFDKDGVSVSDTVVWESTENPTTATWARILGVPIPATATFASLRLYGGVNDTDVAGDIYFDYAELSTTPAAYDITGDFTLAEQSHLAGGGGYVDAGSVVVELPVYGIPCIIVFPAEAKNGDSTGGQRWRVGTNFSNENNSLTPVYVSTSFTIIIPAVDATNPITVYQQLKRVTATTFGRKTVDTSYTEDLNF